MSPTEIDTDLARERWKHGLSADDDLGLFACQVFILAAIGALALSAVVFFVHLIAK